MELRLTLAPQAAVCLLAAILAASLGDAAALSSAPPIPATVRACLLTDPQTSQLTSEGEKTARALRDFLSADIQNFQTFSVLIWQGSLPTSNSYQEDPDGTPAMHDRQLVSSIVGESFGPKLTKIQRFRSSWPPSCEGIDMEIRLNSSNLSCQSAGTCVYICNSGGCGRDQR